MRLEAESLVRQAMANTGLVDFGPSPWREGLDVLCAALEGEGQLNERGRELAHADLLTALEQRLRIERCYADHPEIDAQRIVAPIMVVGLPRSGTSALSQMLAQDPANRSIRRWEANHPTPPPDIATEAQDPRLLATQAMLDRRYAAAPELMVINPLTAEDPSENECYLKLSFMSFGLTGVYHVPSYESWLLEQDLAPAYRYMKRVLKLLQWRRPPDRWNLKAPIDLFALDAVADVFPDARLVWCFRDPAKVVPSVASLLIARRRESMTHSDATELGRSQFTLWLEAAHRAIAYRERPDALPIADIRNADLIRDAVGTVKDLYARIGLNYDDAFDSALRARIVERPKGKFGSHDYTPEDFGLTEAEISAAFAFFSRQFGLEAA